MSDGPSRNDPTRRIDPGDADPTGRVDPVGDPGATRRIDPEGVDHTRAMDPTADDDGYTVVPNRPPGEGPDAPVDEEVVVADAQPPRNRGRDWAIGLGGVAAGVLLAVLIAFLAGGDDPAEGDGTAASDEQIAALEAERDDLQTQNETLTAERDDLLTQNEALEARAADAEASAGDADADVQAQRDALAEREQALDERASSLDQRSTELDEREAQLDTREAELDEREAQIDEAEGAGTTDGTTDGTTGGGELPDIDEEEVQSFIDQILERIRDLF